MDTRKRAALLLLVIGMVSVPVWALRQYRLGDLRPRDARLALAYERSAFDAAAWRSGDEVRRGHMLADLARTHGMVGLHHDSIGKMLGRSGCYVYYDEEPCYYLYLGNQRYQLRFNASQSAENLGTIMRVGLRKASPNSQRGHLE